MTPTERRRALAYNAVGPALNYNGYPVPLYVRRAVADAVLNVIQPDEDAREQDGAYRARALASTVVQARRWADRALTAEAALERVRDRCQGVRDRVGPSGMINASQILGLLSPTWPDGNYEASTARLDPLALTTALGAATRAVQNFRAGTEQIRAAVDEPKEPTP
ncbi:hypothetical protein [Streptomyces sp. NPDC059949]|uniref:hypothetical protein n=1 Tax=Streptomyces sp. NPDC059949 TaxID=3347013 RepID=UPI003658F81D